MLQPLDEFTAHLWAKAGADCPMCGEDGHAAFPLPMQLRRGPDPVLACPVHGPVFAVQCAA